MTSILATPLVFAATAPLRYGVRPWKKPSVMLTDVVASSTTSNQISASCVFSRMAHYLPLIHLHVQTSTNENREIPRQLKKCFIYKKKSVHCVYIKIYKTKIENIKTLKCIQTPLKCNSWKPQALV